MKVRFIGKENKMSKMLRNLDEIDITLAAIFLWFTIEAFCFMMLK